MAAGRSIEGLPPKIGGRKRPGHDPDRSRARSIVPLRDVKQREGAIIGLWEERPWPGRIATTKCTSKGSFATPSFVAANLCSRARASPCAPFSPASLPVTLPKKSWPTSRVYFLPIYRPPLRSPPLPRKRTCPRLPYRKFDEDQAGRKPSASSRRSAAEHGSRCSHDLRRGSCGTCRPGDLADRAGRKKVSYHPRFGFLRSTPICTGIARRDSAGPLELAESS